MAKGRGFGSHAKGERVSDISSLRCGALALMFSPQFDAENTILVTREFEGRIWCTFVSSNDWRQRDGQEFCIWQHELELGVTNLWRVALPTTLQQEGAQ